MDSSPLEPLGRYGGGVERRGTETRRRSHRRTVLTLILLASLLINSFHLHWGLPNGNTTWAADAVAPMTPLSIANKSLSQSGWFYFKYPIGHHMLLLAAYTPYLGWLYLSGQLRRPESDHAYGFTDPERALMVLALIGRVLSVLMATATVALVYALGVHLFDGAAALFGAAAAASSLGLIFYAHTTNLDVPVMFWMLLAFLFAVRLRGEVGMRDCIGIGIAAGMALATKEFAIGILVTLPIVIITGHARQLWPLTAQRLWPASRYLAAGVGVAVVTYAVASNAFINPVGLVNRWRYLTNTLPGEFFGTLVPRPSMIHPTPSLSTHLRFLRELWVALPDTVGLPSFFAALCGVTVALFKSTRAAVLLLFVFVTYYWFALVPVPLVTVRYVLPLSMLLMLFAGVFLSRLAQLGRCGGAVAAVILLAGLAYGGSVDYLLVRDPRYAAENWLGQYAVGRTVEVYNRATFLPRFPSSVKRIEPGFSEITRDGVRARLPDFILLSVADINRVTGVVDTYEGVTKRRRENEAFLAALFSGQLGYRQVARFQTHSPLVRPGVIRSLNPEIAVFGR